MSSSSSSSSSVSSFGHQFQEQPSLRIVCTSCGVVSGEPGFQDPCPFVSPPPRYLSKSAKAKATRLGLAASARSVLDTFGHKLADKHEKEPKFLALCGEKLRDRSTTAILAHFAKCLAVTQSERQLLLGDEYSAKWRQREPKVRLPTSGSLADVYKLLSHMAHTDSVYSGGAPVLPDSESLSAVEKRFLIRLLFAQGSNVWICEDEDGKLRRPRKEDYETPQGTPASTPDKGKRGKKRRHEE